MISLIFHYASNKELSLPVALQNSMYPSAYCQNVLTDLTSTLSSKTSNTNISCRLIQLKIAACVDMLNLVSHPAQSKQYRASKNQT